MHVMLKLAGTKQNINFPHERQVMKMTLRFEWLMFPSWHLWWHEFMLCTQDSVLIPEASNWSLRPGVLGAFNHALVKVECDVKRRKQYLSNYCGTRHALYFHLTTKSFQMVIEKTILELWTLVKSHFTVYELHDMKDYGNIKTRLKHDFTQIIEWSIFSLLESFCWLLMNVFKCISLGGKSVLSIIEYHAQQAHNFQTFDILLHLKIFLDTMLAVLRSSTYVYEH